MMKLYELINPSDAITFFAPSHEIAFCVTVLIGEGMYGAKVVGSSDSDDDVPIFLSSERFDSYTEKRGLDVGSIIENRRREVAQAFQSFSNASALDRRMYEVALKHIDTSKGRESFIAEWNDKRRTSLNNIVARAHALAKVYERVSASVP